MYVLTFAQLYIYITTYIYTRYIYIYKHPCGSKCFLGTSPPSARPANPSEAFLLCSMQVMGMGYTSFPDVSHVYIYIYIHIIECIYIYIYTYKRYIYT